LKDTYFLRSFVIKNQKAFYGEHVNELDILRGMLVFCIKEAQIFHSVVFESIIVVFAFTGQWKSRNVLMTGAISRSWLPITAHTARGCMCSSGKLLMMDTLGSETC
jgi:hypothetical protein